MSKPFENAKWITCGGVADIKQQIEEKYRNICRVKPGTTKEEYKKTQTEYAALISKFSKKEQVEMLSEIIEKISKEEACLPHPEQEKRCAEILQMIEDILSDNIFDSEKNEAKVVRREYATGGERLYRGYYCPSKIADIVVGNMKRGRLLKRVKGSKPTYCYGFDKNDRIISAKKILPDIDDEYEFIYYKDNEQFGVKFCGYAISVAISKFENDKIISYELFRYSVFNKKIDEYKKETYRYYAERMEVVCESYSPESNLFALDRYDFSVKDGFLSDYLADGVREYTVDTKIKRKI